jgi:hypothetical protein
MSQIIDKNTTSSPSLDEKIKKIMDKEDGNFIENESFADRWEKSIPIEEARTHLLKTVKDLWNK